MKIYRALPYEKIRYEKEIVEKYKKIEDIYYNMGCIPFDDGNTIHTSNNIYKELPNKTSEIGKYFFLFPEDAIYNSETLNYVHDINSSSIFLAEYDVPIDIVLEYIGYGDYSGDFFHKKNYCLECFISIDDLGNEIIESSSIDNEKKIDLFIKSMNNIITSGTSIIYYPDFYKKILEVSDLNYIKNNMELLKEKLKNNPFLTAFIKEEVKVVKCPFITSKIIIVDCEKLLFDCGSPKYIADYFKRYDIHVDFTKEHRLYKQQLLNYAGINKKKKDREMIRKLLR